MGRIAARKLRRVGYPIRLARAAAGALPFPDAAFKAIVCTFPTPFILEPSTLREAARVLRPNGQLVIVPNAVLTGGGADAAAVEWLYRITGQRGGARFDLAAHFAQFGFKIAIEQAECPRSLVTIIIAEHHYDSATANVLE